MPPPNRIANAVKRSEVHKKTKRDKAQAKLARRMAQRKLERQGGDEGLKARKERLEKNVPRTLDNTREFDATSYLTANPETLRQLHEGRRKQTKVQPEEEQASSEDEEEEEEEESDEEMTEQPEAGPSRPKVAAVDEVAQEEEEEEEEEAAAAAEQPMAPSIPRILLTTSPSATRTTYTFLQELESVFPGSESYKRLKGRGFELGRIARWAAKRDFQAMVIVNEDHKKPNAITVIQLPAGPTAYFKLTSVQLSKEIAGHARASPHSPELILNNFSTLLGHSVGRIFGALFPPQPMLRGRQVVTLHNQRDFLFFRRHRYMFASIDKAKLQEIGPRFTLKLRWLRKGLPSVLAADGVAPGGGDKESEEEEEEDDEEEEAVEMQQGDGEDDQMEGKDKPVARKKDTTTVNGVPIPALDAQEEFEWKWKVSPSKRFGRDCVLTNYPSCLAQDGSLSENVLFVDAMSWGFLNVHVLILVIQFIDSRAHALIGRSGAHPNQKSATLAHRRDRGRRVGFSSCLSVIWSAR